MEDSDGQLAVIEYCPICSLMCDCAKCERRLISVSYALMNKCEEQGKPPNEASFDDILKACVAKRKAKNGNGVTKLSIPQTNVWCL